MAYKNVVKNQDISRYKKKYEDLDSLLYKEISNIKKSSDLQKKLDGYEYWMFIPMSVINKIKEISLLGQTEKYFSSIDTENKTSNQTISKLLPNLNSQKE
jgi:predicted site-specific integrase-resolvase